MDSCASRKRRPLSHRPPEGARFATSRSATFRKSKITASYAHRRLLLGGRDGRLPREGGRAPASQEGRRPNMVYEQQRSNFEYLLAIQMQIAGRRSYRAQLANSKGESYESATDGSKIQWGPGGISNQRGQMRKLRLDRTDRRGDNSVWPAARLCFVYFLRARAPWRCSYDGK